VPKTPKSGAGLERNQVPLSAEITCRFRPKSGAGLLRFLQSSSELLEDQVRHIQFDSPQRMTAVPISRLFGRSGGIELVWERVG